MNLSTKVSRLVIGLLYLVALFLGVALLISGKQEFGTPQGSLMLMAGSLVAAWVFAGGILMFLIRNKVAAWVQNLEFSWPKKFVLFASLLVLAEEAITTTLTNLGSVFGSEKAFITASSNYLEVVVFHSAIVIIPMFFAWVWLLKKYDFSTEAVFLLFGFSGIVAEIFIGGPSLALAPMWIFVYGLMIFLPRYSLPKERGAMPPKFRHYFLALLLPFLASAVIALVVSSLSPHLPHFGEELKIEDFGK